MTIEAGLTEFAEYLGGEIRRVENKIPTVGGNPIAQLALRLLPAKAGRISPKQQVAKSPGTSQTVHFITPLMVAAAGLICGTNRPASGRLFMVTQVTSDKLKRLILSKDM